MAAIINDRDILLQASNDRLLSTTLSPTVSVSGNVTGTLNNIPVQDVIDAANTGGGDITVDILENSATAINVTSSNLFTLPGSGSAGVFIGSGGLFGKNAVGITTFSIDASNGNAIFSGALSGATGIFSGELSAATGTFSGNISGGSNINIFGQAVFQGNNNVGGVVAAMHVNNTFASPVGISVTSNSNFAINAIGFGNNGSGISGHATGVSGVGVTAAHSSGGTALKVNGKMTITSYSFVPNLYAARSASADSANFVSGGNVSGAVATANNSNLLGGFQANSWVRIIATNSGNANASGAGFQLHSTVAGVRTRAAGGNLVVIESFSDSRYKENVVDETYGLAFINALRPVQYEIKESARKVSDLSSKSAKKITLPSFLYHGFLSGEVKGLVSDSKDCIFQTHSDGVEGVDYMSLIAPLVKSIQELSAKVDTLETQANV